MQENVKMCHPARSNGTENMPLTLQTFANLCEFLRASLRSILRFPKCDNDATFKSHNQLKINHTLRQ